MNFLGELTEKDVGIANPKESCGGLKLRRTVRAVAFNDKGKMPAVLLTTNKYHILPGGSLDPGEALMVALSREFEEEVGYKVKATKDVGVIITHEYCSDTLQINYCYLGKVGEKSGEITYSEEESAQSPKVKWFTLDETIKTFKNDKPKDNYGKFNSARDLKFLQEAKRIMIPEA